MERREALRLLATAAALPLVSGELNALLRTARAKTQSNDATLRTLNPQQNNLVVRIAEIILPETDTPGATTARVNQFIDLILTEWYDPNERNRFLKGLADVDTRARTRFGKEFMALVPDQQTQVVKELDDEMVAESAPETGPDHPADGFFSAMKQLTLTGYFTSEPGATQQLHFEIIPGHYDGCVPSDAKK
jgi:hypothetical protein